MGRSFRLRSGEKPWYVVIDGSKVLHIARRDREWTHSACGRYYNNCRVLVCRDLVDFDEFRAEFAEIYAERRRDSTNSACFLVDEAVMNILVKDFGFRVCLACQRYT